MSDAQAEAFCRYLEARGYRISPPDPAARTAAQLLLMQQETEESTKFLRRKERQELLQRTLSYWLENFGINDTKRVFGYSTAYLYMLRRREYEKLKNPRSINDWRLHADEAWLIRIKDDIANLAQQDQH